MTDRQKYTLGGVGGALPIRKTNGATAVDRMPRTSIFRFVRSLSFGRLDKGTHRLPGSANQWT